MNEFEMSLMNKEESEKEKENYFNKLKRKKKELSKLINSKNINKKALKIILLTIIFTIILGFAFFYFYKDSFNNIEDTSETTKKVKILGKIDSNLENIKYSFDNKYLLGLEYSSKYYYPIFKFLDKDSFNFISISMYDINQFEKYAINDYISLPNDKIAVIEKAEKIINSTKYYLEQVSIYSYKSKIKLEILHTIIYQKNDTEIMPSTERFPKELFYANDNKLIINIDSPNEKFYCPPKFIDILDLDTYSVNRIEFKDMEIINIIDLIGDYLLVDMKFYYYEDYELGEEKVYETYYNKLLDVKNNLTVFKEFSKTAYENKGFKGFIKRKFTLRKNTFYEIIEDDLSYSFYTLNISNDIDKISFIKSDIFPSFTDEKRKYSHMIKYNDNTVLFISDEGKMELFNIESKRFTSVDSNIFGNNINIKNILSVYSFNEEEFSFSFIDGIIILYKF